MGRGETFYHNRNLWGPASLFEKSVKLFWPFGESESQHFPDDWHWQGRLVFSFSSHFSFSSPNTTEWSNFPTTLNIFYASFISFLRRFMNMRLWHFPRPNHSFAHLLKYFTSKLKNEEFISIKTRCQIWCTIELHRHPISKVVKMVLNTQCYQYLWLSMWFHAKKVERNTQKLKIADFTM